MRSPVIFYEGCGCDSRSSWPRSWPSSPQTVYPPRHPGSALGGARIGIRAMQAVIKRLLLRGLHLACGLQSLPPCRCPRTSWGARLPAVTLALMETEICDGQLLINVAGGTRCHSSIWRSQSKVQESAIVVFATLQVRSVIASERKHYPVPLVPRERDRERERESFEIVCVKKPASVCWMSGYRCDR